MTVNVDQNVLRLNISVDNALVMNILHALQHLYEVKFGLLLCKLLHFAQVKEHFSSSA